MLLIGLLLCVFGMLVTCYGIRQPWLDRQRALEYERRFERECTLETDPERLYWEEDPRLIPFEQWCDRFDWPLEWRVDYE